MNHSFSRASRPAQIVGGTRNDALRILKITPAEQVAFATYLNFAVNNLAEVAGVGLSDEKEVRNALFAGGSPAGGRRIRRLADFLWTFREKDPAADEAGYKRTLGNGHDDMAVWVAERIVALRNFFVHVNERSHLPLLLDRSQYVFLEGLLGDAARKAAMAPGLNPAKAQKLKLATRHRPEDHSYEFTRKGLVFMTCLALYKDEAEEFCHLFGEMKAPDSIDGEDLEEEQGDGLRRRVLGAADMEKFKGLKGKGRALIELFTFHAYRRGRQSLDAANDDFMCFADIVGWLNTVPEPAFEFLPLERERSELDALAAASAEIEKNKRTKYVLRRRDGNRFLSLAAAYCEDFGVFPSIRFKRLDVRRTSGRHQYLFGGAADGKTDDGEANRVRMNRHYAIRRDALPFEFVPDRHYGPIRIGALRSALSATEMRKLLYLHAQGTPDKPVGVDAAFRSYFEAYHRVLERLVNAGSLAEVSLEDETHLADFAAICGTTPEAFKADPAAFRPFVPESLRRYFTKETGSRTDAQLLERLRNRIRTEVLHACDILVRHDALVAWRRNARPWLDARDAWRREVDAWRTAHAGGTAPMPLRLADFDEYLKDIPPASRPVRPDDPRCRIGAGEGEVNHPPTWCRFSDADYVSFVFTCLNLFLPNDRKFRQLPLSEQHREGPEDHLFQLVHAAIGKFSLDQKGLWTLLERQRPELSGLLAGLQERLHGEACVRPLAARLNQRLAAHRQLPEGRRVPEPGGEAEDGEAVREANELYSGLLAAVRGFRARDFFGFLTGTRPELQPCCRELGRLLDEEMARKPRRKDGRPPFPKLEDLFKVAQIPRRPSPTLEDLAVAAVTLSLDLLREEAGKWEAADAARIPREELLAACRRFGVRPGMPVERKSLLKTIFGIDHDAWRHAFDYSREKPFENRRLEDGEHVAAQIPLPNGFSDRLAAALPRKIREAFGKPGAAAPAGAFDFNAAFRAWSPDPHVALRDFYDASPLVESLVARKHPAAAPDGTRRAPSPFDALEPHVLDAAVREIKNAENQDKALLFAAMEYWRRFQGTDTFSKKAMPFSETTTLREFFDSPVKIQKDGLTVTLLPNVVNRPAFATLFGESRASGEYRRKIARLLSPDGSRTVFDFFEMNKAFCEQKARDRRERLLLAPYIVNFDAACEIPASEYARVSEGLVGDAKKEAVRTMEFERYKAVLAGLTREDYDIVADTRNAAFHTGFGLDGSKAMEICKRLGISGTMPGQAPADGGKPRRRFGPDGRPPRRFHGPPRGGRR